MKQKNIELFTINSRLKNLNDVQREFGSTLSHELRTPLSSIKAGIDIVMSKTAGPLTDEQSKFLGKSKDSVDRLNRLINNILDLAQMESGKKKLNFASGNINDMVNFIAESQQPVAMNKGLEMHTQLDTHVPAMVFDKDKITQVLNNLINNAIKFTETGSITVTTHYQIQGNHVEITVADTGPGIKDEDISKLFQKFQQLGEAHTQVSGTGLGLAICKEIVRQHGGTIEASSRQGFGTTISFILPLEERRRR